MIDGTDQAAAFAEVPHATHLLAMPVLASRILDTTLLPSGRITVERRGFDVVLDVPADFTAIGEPAPGDWHCQEIDLDDAGLRRLGARVWWERAARFAAVARPIVLPSVSALNDRGTHEFGGSRR